MSPRRVVLVELARETTATHVARLLRDAGVEVVHAGYLESAEQIVRTVEQEDPDVVGLLGGPPPRGLREALGDVEVAAIGDKTPEEAAEMLAGVRTHTRHTPSDRAR
ncbi:cobalamin-dependent protein [Amycolatopsis jejuensis]|uniref:cobalamin-dependent protein n=1 Tax=Amycolatopsis jejuensis TaxID=330084 RepID=UPI0005278179|nr:cobalamin-dependent protein [Amycolatopsis jejuensis]